MQEEQSLIIFKPDAVHRGLLGEIVHRFERKGLKIAALKMVRLSDKKLEEHYSHHADKPFFADLKNFMQQSPVVMCVVSGFNAIKATRLIVGPTAADEADAGTIRGDFAMSVQSNLVHASDSLESAKEEISRFFSEEEIFEYERNDSSLVYSHVDR